MKLKFLLFLLIFGPIALAQRTFPNPVVLVHGWTGSNQTWNEFAAYLEADLKLKVDRNSLNFNLNCDGNTSTSRLSNDVCDNSSAFMRQRQYLRFVFLPGRMVRLVGGQGDGRRMRASLYFSSVHYRECG